MDEFDLYMFISGHDQRNNENTIAAASEHGEIKTATNI